MGCGASKSQASKPARPPTPDSWKWTEDASAQLDEEIPKLAGLNKKPGPLLPEGQLSLTVVKAKGCSKGWFEIGGADPFCIAEVGDEEFKTETVKRTVDPTWNSTMSFELDGTDVFLTLGVFDDDRFTEDDMLGAGVVPLSDFGDQEPKEMWVKAQLGVPKTLLGKEVTPPQVFIKGKFTSKERLCTVQLDGLAAISDELMVAEALGSKVKRTVLDRDEQRGFVEFESLGARDMYLRQYGKGAGLQLDGATVRLSVPDPLRSAREHAVLINTRKANKAAAERAEMEAKMEAARKEQEEAKKAAEMERLRLAEELKEQKEQLAEELDKLKALDEQREAEDAKMLGDLQRMIEEERKERELEEERRKEEEREKEQRRKRAAKKAKQKRARILKKGLNRAAKLLG